MSEKKYYLIDIESGFKYEVSKEEHKSYMNMVKSFRPKINGSYKGMIMVYGTSGEMRNLEDLNKIFYEAI